MNNLESNRGRNITPPKYPNAMANYTPPDIMNKRKELTPNRKSRSKMRVFSTEDYSNERQEEIFNKEMLEKDYQKSSFQDLLYCI